MAQRGDAELASVMRKLIDSEAFIAVATGPLHGGPSIVVDDTTIMLTEDELQAVLELTGE